MPSRARPFLPPLVQAVDSSTSTLTPRRATCPCACSPPLQGWSELGRVGDMLAMTAEGLQDFVVADVRHIGSHALWVPCGEPHAGLQVAAHDPRVVVDEEDDGQLVTHRRLHLHAIEAEGTVSVD